MFCTSKRIILLFYALIFTIDRFAIDLMDFQQSFISVFSLINTN